MSEITVGVLGAQGRMGSESVRALEAADGIAVVARIDADEPLEQLVEAGASVAVDFTSPDAVMDNLRFCVGHGIHAVVGTSGFDDARIAEVRDLVELRMIAFPQDGILSFPNGKELMREAMRLGCDVIGGIPHYEWTREDGVEEVHFLFDLARETGEFRWSRVKARPLRGPGGRVTHAINVIEDITAHKRAELAQRFLAESSSVLGSSLDPDELLREVAALTVPDVADWCAVDLRDTNGGIARVALAHADPGMVAHLRELARRYPFDPDAPRGVPKVVRTGSPEVYEEIPDALLREAAVDAEHHRLLSELQLRSAMLVPMIARGRTIGALSLATGPSGRRFDGQDLELAEELARRCASAVDNARLYEAERREAELAKESLAIANALLDFSREVSTAEGMDEVLSRLVEQTSRTLAAPVQCRDPGRTES